MLHHPFQILQKYRPDLDIFFLTKENSVQTDTDVAKRIGTTNIASLWQVHGNQVIVVRGQTQRTEKADGCITHERDLLLTIRAADCQQILVYAPKQRVVGLMHVGWRGLLEKTIHAFFKKLHGEWSIPPQDTLVGIGPSLRQCCAEYSEADHPLRQFPAHFWNGNTVDLAGIADMQLAELGIPKDGTERHPDCTCCHPEKYWTYRGGDRERVLQGYTNVLAAHLEN